VNKALSEQVRVSRELGIAKPRRRLPRQASTAALERDYASRILQLVDSVIADLDELLTELPSLVLSAQNGRNDSLRLDVGEGRISARIMAKIREQFRRRLSSDVVRTYTTETANRLSEFNRQQLLRQLKSALGIDILITDKRLAAIVDGFVSENVALIKNVPEKLVSDVVSTVLRGLQSGTNTKKLTE